MGKTEKALNAQAEASLTAEIVPIRAISENTVQALCERGKILATKRKALGLSKPAFIGFFKSAGVAHIVSKALAAHQFYAWCTGHALDLNTAGKVSGEVVQIVTGKYAGKTPSRDELETVLMPFTISDVKARSAAVTAMLRDIGEEEKADKREAAQERARLERRLGATFAAMLGGKTIGKEELNPMDVLKELLAPFPNAASQLIELAETLPGWEWATEEKTEKTEEVAA